MLGGTRGPPIVDEDDGSHGFTCPAPTLPESFCRRGADIEAEVMTPCQEPTA
jgi:hypothetical protein